MGLQGRKVPGLSPAGDEGVTGNLPRVGGRMGPVGGYIPGNPGFSHRVHPKNALMCTL